MKSLTNNLLRKLACIFLILPVLTVFTCEKSSATFIGCPNTWTPINPTNLTLTNFQGVAIPKEIYDVVNEDPRNYVVQEPTYRSIQMPDGTITRFQMYGNLDYNLKFSGAKIQYQYIVSKNGCDEKGFLNYFEVKKDFLIENFQKLDFKTWSSDINNLKLIHLDSLNYKQIADLGLAISQCSEDMRAAALKAQSQTPMIFYAQAERRAKTSCGLIQGYKMTMFFEDLKCFHPTFAQNGYEAFGIVAGESCTVNLGYPDVSLVGDTQKPIIFSTVNLVAPPLDVTKNSNSSYSQGTQSPNGGSNGLSNQSIAQLQQMVLTLQDELAKVRNQLKLICSAKKKPKGC